MIDFTLIDNGEDFELLCEDLLRRKGFVIQTRPSRGADFGADMIVEITNVDSLGCKENLRILVECKHYAKSNRSVREEQIGNIIERTISHNCNRYLLITSTVPSTSVRNQLESISNNPTINISAMFWAKNDLNDFINEYPDIVRKYFTNRKILMEQKSEKGNPRLTVCIHAHPDFSDELNSAVSIWNDCQTHALFKLVKPSQHNERMILVSGDINDKEAAIIANTIREAAGYTTDEYIIQFCEKRLHSRGYYQLFASGTKHSEIPPNTATISLYAMRRLSEGYKSCNNLVLSMLLTTIIHVVSEGVGLESHDEMRKCIMDFDNDMSDILSTIAEGPTFCKKCSKQLQRMGSDFMFLLAKETQNYIKDNMASDVLTHKLSLREKRLKEFGDDYTYDVALSFAGEDRGIAEKLAKGLTDLGIKVFYDNYEKSKLWGQDLYSYLSDLYRLRSKYCVMLISKYYADKSWTNHERQAAQERAFKENRPYILPIKIDDTEIPGILSTTGYLHLENDNIDDIVVLLNEKLTNS